MKIEDLRKDYDELQVKYGAKELDSIYNGGCEKNPDICFVFMNPTGKNIASDKSWKGRKSPWLGTKNIWKLFYKVDLLSEEIFNKIQEKKPKEWDYEFCNYVYEEIEKNNAGWIFLDYRNNMNKLDKKYGLLLSELFDWRQKGDSENIFDYDNYIVNNPTNDFSDTETDNLSAVSDTKEEKAEERVKKENTESSLRRV